MNEMIQALRILSVQWKAIKVAGGTLDVDSLMAEIERITKESPA